MSHFVAERYVSSEERCDAAADAERLRAAAVALGRIRFMQTVYLPADELCLYLFECDSAERVAELGRRALLDIDRIHQAEVSP